MTRFKSLAPAVGFALALLAGTVATAAGAKDFKVGDIEIDQPWARATVGAAPNGVVYMTIKNMGPAADRLVDVASPAADQAQLHQMEVTEDVMKMWLIGSIDIPAGQSVALAPNGLHVMLLGLKQPLEENSTFPLTLTFEKAGSVTVTAVVGKIGATEPPESN